ncbi:MAG: hypothetical protein GY725_09505 [bacterium]|nr:hypothetical protein [bacterium]
MLQRITRKSGVPDLVDVLTERLSASDLQTLLLEVYRRHVAAQSAPDLLARYRRNRFVRPAGADPAGFRAFDALAFSHLPESFSGLELSPLSPLGACSSVASVNQDKVISAGRGTEACADPTNALALECAVRRREILASGSNRHERVRLCTSQRVARAQALLDASHVPHFRLFSLCTAGRDEGSFSFETSALREQLDFWLRTLADAADIGKEISCIRLEISDFSDGLRLAALRDSIEAPLRRDHPDVEISVSDTRESGRGYYVDTAFKIFLSDASGAESEVGDGGVVDWSQRMLANRKERMVISGFGVDRFVWGFAPTAGEATA